MSNYTTFWYAAISIVNSPGKLQMPLQHLLPKHLNAKSPVLQTGTPAINSSRLVYEKSKTQLLLNLEIIITKK